MNRRATVCPQRGSRAAVTRHVIARFWATGVDGAAAVRRQERGRASYAPESQRSQGRMRRRVPPQASRHRVPELHGDDDRSDRATAKPRQPQPVCGAARALPYLDRRTLVEHELPAAARPGASLRRCPASSSPCSRSGAPTSSRGSSQSASTPPARRVAAAAPGRSASTDAARPLPHRLACRSVTRRRLDTVCIARTDHTGSPQPAGSAELGLGREDRERLCEALEQRSTGARRGGHGVAAGIWLEIDFHGAPRGPRRDPVIRQLRLET